MPETTPSTIGLLGARSPVGDELVRAAPSSVRVLRFSRQRRPSDEHGQWYSFDDAGPEVAGLDVVVSLIPIWVLSERTDWLQQAGCRHLVVLSSTSRFTKVASEREADRDVAQRLSRGEDDLLAWGREHDVAVTILRPTMIYGSEQDGNVSSIRSTLRRFRFFPVVGPARGLRQPVHAADVADAALRSASTAPERLAPAYNVSGAEVLTYRAMVDRVRRGVPGPTFVLRVPGFLFRAAERIAPGSSKVHTAAGMAARMSTDMTFDHSAASADFGYAPRPFEPPSSS
jgi:nucleoside-diphosphate-sugar epimerase